MRKNVLDVLSKNEDIPTCLLADVTDVHVVLNVPLVKLDPAWRTMFKAKLKALDEHVKNNKGKGFRPVSGKQIPPGGVGTRYIPDGMTLIEAINQNEIYKDPKGKRRA